MTEGEPAIQDLTAHEVRVLGCLVEKEATTPDAYPLTLNSLRHACNQSTSRDPVVAYTDHEIEQALAALRRRGLTRTVHSTSNRAVKFRHVLPDVLDLDAAETAVLSVLMLRGAQTVGELKGRTERQHRFESIDEVTGTLAALAGRDVPLVRRLERQAGQKDARWIHLLAPGGDDDIAAASVAVPPRAAAPADPYGEATAEFYDLLAAGAWETMGLQLLDLLADVDPGDGPIIDIGSGTGIGLAYLQAAAPGAELLAIEPSKAMRVALHTRLAESPPLCRATTVSATTFADAPLPERAAAVVVAAAFGHLCDAERERLWNYLVERMPAGAPVVIGVLPPARPSEVALVRYSSRTVGRHVYEGWQSGVPIDGRSMSWTMIYKVVDEATGELVAEHRAVAPWRCDGVDDLRAEIAPLGLTLAEHGEWIVVRGDGSRTA